MSGVFENEVVYGPGGHNPAKPNNNIVSQKSVELPIPVANERQIRARAAAALAANKTFLAIASPTAAQVAAQTKALTRQTNAILRILMSQFDDASDT